MQLVHKLHVSQAVRCGTNIIPGFWILNNTGYTDLNNGSIEASVFLCLV